MKNKKNVKVCLSPNQFSLYSDEKSIVVIIDILRATTVISTAFKFGVKDILPVKSVQEVKLFKNKKNCIVAAERNTLPIKGIKFGNSPFQYISNNEIIDKTLVLTTTNGTKAINLAKEHNIVTMSLINIDAVYDFLLNYNSQNVIILCSGWKNFINLEDTICAGNLCHKLLSTNQFISNCDSSRIAMEIFLKSKNNLFEFLRDSSYRKRNYSPELVKDSKFCLNPNFYSDIVPFYENGRLVKKVFDF